ncbi:MAG: NTP transferase domain-containing protein [Sphingomicrobium sp.]
MAVGALIGAYQENGSGELRALLPLAGRTLFEYQARCVAAAGAAPIVVLVERVPPALYEAFERLRVDGLPVIPVSDGNEAASRFEAGSLILLVGDGVAAPADLLAQLAEEAEPAVATVPDDEPHENHERIDASSRWAGVALINGRTLGATAAMLGDWDLQSTLLRRALQDGALRVRVASTGEPMLAESAEQLGEFERGLIASSRGVRNDWASRFVLPVIEEFSTERLLDTSVRPQWLIWSALTLTVAAAFAFTRGWLGPAIGLLALSTPLDLVARRLAALRLRPLPPRSISGRLLWPAAGLALLALGWRLFQHGGGWGSVATAVTVVAFAEAARIEQGHDELPGQVWLFSRRNAILAAVPFAIAGQWAPCLVALALYAAGSFFYVQHWHHRITTN